MPGPAADFIFIGTGLAPLVAAQRLLSEGASVMLVNPEPAYFSENSELPLAPFLMLGPGNSERCQNARPSEALDVLRPVFPGAVEFEPIGPAQTGSPASRAASGFTDPLAPRIRTRDHFFLFSENEDGDVDAWEELTRSAGLHPRRLDELTARLRIPGLSSQRRQEWLESEAWDPSGSLQIQRLCDLDLERFRRGILDFVEERLGPSNFCAGAGIPEFVGPHALRIQRGRTSEIVHAGTAVVVFGSASTIPWSVKQWGAPTGLAARHFGNADFWEHWTLLSREDLDPSVVVHLSKQAVIYAELEGSADQSGAPRSRLLHVLRRIDSGRSMSPVSERSIRGLATLCTADLGWERFSIRALRTGASRLPVSSDAALVREVPGFAGKLNFWSVPGAGGPVVDVVRNVNRAVDELLGPNASLPPAREGGEPK